jgi:hypothetical protein
MREELLAHVWAVFDEEFEQLGNERAAVVAARRRFGAAKDLGYQLQTSVPVLGDWFLLFDKEHLMSRWIWLSALAAFAVGMAILLPAFAAIKQQGVYQALPLVFGGLVTLAGVAVFGYGVVRRLIRAA